MTVPRPVHPPRATLGRVSPQTVLKTGDSAGKNRNGTPAPALQRGSPGFRVEMVVGRPLVEAGRNSESDPLNGDGRDFERLVSEQQFPRLARGTEHEDPRSIAHRPE